MSTLSQTSTVSTKVPLSPEVDFLESAMNAFSEGQDKEGTDSPIVFYCKDCKSVTEVEKKPNKLNFRCKKCRSERIAFGTEKSLQNFYHIHS